MNLNDLPEPYRKQAREQLAKTHRVAPASSDVEPPISNAPVAKKKDEGYDSCSRIHVHSVRKRLADADGISGKAAIDGLVQEGILRNDSPQYVNEVSYSQEKTKSDEYTVIEIWSAEEESQSGPQKELELK